MSTQTRKTREIRDVVDSPIFRDIVASSPSPRLGLFATLKQLWQTQLNRYLENRHQARIAAENRCEACNESYSNVLPFVESCQRWKSQIKLCEACIGTVKECEDCHTIHLPEYMKTFLKRNVCQNCHYELTNKRFKVIKFCNDLVHADSFKFNPHKRFCGVEIECINRNVDANSFTTAELKKFHFSQFTDGSVNGSGNEFASWPMNGDLLYQKVLDFCNELNRRKYYVDNSCGLHIHLQVDKTNLDLLKKIFVFYMKYDKQIYGILPKKRRNSAFCGGMRYTYGDLDVKDLLATKSVPAFEEQLDPERYCGVNFVSLFSRRSTLEIRCHSGTTNPLKILMWFKIHLTILDRLEKMTLQQVIDLKDTTKDFLKLFDITTRKYIALRTYKFNEGNFKKEEALQLEAGGQRYVPNTACLQLR